MTVLSRRAFGTGATAAAASLLVGCSSGGEGVRTSGTPSSGATPTQSATGNRTSAKSARAVGRSAPVRLRIPALGVDTPVMRLGLASDGTVQVPPLTDHDQAGWYEHSPTPGQTGPSVILGHVTVGEYGDGVFHDLTRLRRGEKIVARLENGTETEFTVTSLRTVAKADFPVDDVYGNVDRPELRLITCGGPRDENGYLDNVIAFAALTSSTSP
ncbi:class F sortase [Streptomyces lacrimifluminis]|uniref:Class F sortase n=1 Tax=Streptomyces lacrimifluminis TaxID=1500077 RepID=A0A917KH93_9ACTN|nr:class F sortase [Streptomyces lacrimifluminis]GGJ09867.1 class F sortase [Streptomyces lacrimifluminis]